MSIPLRLPEEGLSEGSAFGYVPGSGAFFLSHLEFPGVFTPCDFEVDLALGKFEFSALFLQCHIELLILVISETLENNSDEASSAPGEDAAKDGAKDF